MQDIANTPVVSGVRKALDDAYRKSVERVAGVALLSVSPSHALPGAMASIAHMILHRQVVVDMPTVPISTVSVFRPIESRSLEPLNVYAFSDIDARKLQMLAIERDDVSSLEPPKALTEAKAKIQSGACFFLQIHWATLSDDDTIIELERLDGAAREMGALVVIFMANGSKSDSTYLSEHCSMYAEIDACEPDPDAQVAFAMSNVTLRGWHAFGIGRVLVEMLMLPDATLAYREGPLHAERALTRLAWYLAHSGVPLVQIPKIIGPTTKPNVLVDLAAQVIQPFNSVGIVAPPNWVRRWASRYSTIMDHIAVCSHATGRHDGQPEIGAVTGDANVATPRASHSTNARNPVRKK